MLAFGLFLILLPLQEPSSSGVNLTPAQIFEQSAKAHLGGRSEVQIEDFHLRFNLIVRDRQNNFEFRANHIFKKPHFVKTTLDDPDYGVRIDTGFNGTSYWLHDKDHGSIELAGKEHGKDIREIDERIRLSQILAKTFSVKRFMEDLKNEKRLPDEKTPYGKRIVVQAQAKDFVLIKSPKIHKETDVILYFDPETFLLREIFATPPPSKRPVRIGEGVNQLKRSEKIILSEHTLIQEVLLPTRIEIFVGKEAKRPHYEITIGEFNFNVGYKEEDFRIPR